MPTSKESQLQNIEQADILIVRDMQMSSFFGNNQDFVFPHIVLTLTLSDTATVKAVAIMGGQSSEMASKTFIKSNGDDTGEND